MAKMNSNNKPAKAKTAAGEENSAMPFMAQEGFGGVGLGHKFDETDLGDDLPNSYVNESGDSNQMSRSEEEELENNINEDPTRMKKIEKIVS